MKAESWQAQLNCISIVVWACEKSNTPEATAKKKPNAQEDKNNGTGDTETGITERRGRSFQMRKLELGKVRGSGGKACRHSQ